MAPLYRIVKDEVRGQYMRAERGIRMGTVILSERPILRVTRQGNTDENELDAALQQLTSEDRQHFDSLDHGGRGPSSAKKRFDNNSYRFDDANGDWAVIYRDLCRLNHSCIPTARTVQNTDERTLDLVALTDLKKDDEISISYATIDETTGWPPFTSRDKDLKRYGFDCDCELCADIRTDQRGTRARRARLALLRNRLNRRTHGTLEEAEEYCDLIEEELGKVRGRSGIPKILDPRLVRG